MTKLLSDWVLKEAVLEEGVTVSGRELRDSGNSEDVVHCTAVQFPSIWWEE